MQLLLVMPKQGSGTTNDGNTSRRFFSNPEKSAEIIIILSAISSGYHINVAAFKECALETARLYVRLYDWFYMPASVHIVLIHGADIIDSMILPIGQLPEDVQEARHKEYRKYRKHQARSR